MPSHPGSNRHSLTTLRRIVLPCLLAAALVLALPTSAFADCLRFKDKVGDVSIGADLERVTVHNDRRVRVRTWHDDLRPVKSPANLAIYFDTRAKRRGPEYVFSGGLGATRDWQIWRSTKDWTARGRSPLPCPVDLAVDHDRDRATVTLQRSCLGGHSGKIRVAVSALEVKADGDLVRDWAPARRTFSGWVAR